MPKNDSPCDRAREIALAVYTFAVQPGNWEKLRKQAEAFISEAAEYRQRMRQGHAEGKPWTGRTPSLAAKCALLAALHDQCFPDNRILEPAASDGDDDGAWWAQSVVYGWIRPALKGNADSRSADRQDKRSRGADRLGDLQKYLENVKVALAKQASRKKKHRRRKRQTGTVKPLTPRQTEAMHMVSECKGNIAEAARSMGLNRKTVEQHYKAACKKLGRNAPKRYTGQLPTDRRGQAGVAGQDDGPAPKPSQPNVMRDRRG